MTETSALIPADPASRPSRRLGIVALVLALLAVLGDVVTTLVGVGSIRSFDDSVGAALGLAAVFLGFGAIALVVGLLLAIVALLLAIIALVTDRGRRPAVFGLVLSILVIVTHGILLAALASAGNGLLSLGG